MIVALCLYGVATFVIKGYFQQPGTRQARADRGLPGHGWYAFDCPLGGSRLPDQRHPQSGSGYPLILHEAGIRSYPLRVWGSFRQMPG